MITLLARLARRATGREWLPAIAWAAAVLAVSSIPSSTLGGNLFPGCDKLAHFIEYSVLGGLLAFWAAARRGSSQGDAVGARGAGAGGPESGGRPGRTGPPGGLGFWLVLAAIAFAGLDEVHQRLIPGRQMDFWDFAADVAGITAGFLVARRFLPAWLRHGFFERGAR